MLLTLLVGFVIGILTIIVLQVLGFVFLLNRLIAKNHQLENKLALVPANAIHDLDHQQSLHFASTKQGVIWLLESGKVAHSFDPPPNKDQKRKEVLEVSPVRKHATINKHSLLLTDSDGYHTASVCLKGCTIQAVSATGLPSRKWAKRYPIVVESKDSVIYRGSKTFYLYFETSWEKESWSKALRIASYQDHERLQWFHSLTTDFQNYLTSLNAGYPAFMKPSLGCNADPIERENKLDAPSSKVRLFLKKITKKASKSSETKPTWNVPSSREERKFSDKSRSFQDTFATSATVKSAPSRRTSLNPVEEDTASTLPYGLSHSGSTSHVSISSDTDADDKFSIDQGTLCWNLLISRLFFDAKKNAEMTTSIQARIQRTLSNMRTPSYIGEVICSGMNLGNLPPYIHGMRILSTDMNEVWAFEVDVEYSGGLVLDMETRLEVRELENRKRLDDENSESGSVGEVTSDLLEGYEYFKNQFSLSEITSDVPETEEGQSKLDRLKSSKNMNSTSAPGSRWKSILNSVAKQVSQVPLSLAIRIASIRGVMRLHIKPPPSDQLWFGFTSMPDIDFNLASSIGDHKITSGHIALFLVNRFKVAIRDTMVLPNCECLSMPWMLAEKDDWVPRKVAPFMWLNQEGTGETTTVTTVHPEEVKTKTESSKVTSSDLPVDKSEVPTNKDSVKEEERNECAEAVITNNKPSVWSSKAVQDLKKPLLLKNDRGQSIEENAGIQSRSLSMNTSEGSYSGEDDESRPKRVGRKARMFDLGKKMGEKIEEKRRHIEEKSRNIVDKMRGP